MITNTTNRTLLSMSGTVYDFQFRIDDETELKVYGITSGGVSTLLTTGFTVSFDSENEEGTVTFAVEPTSYAEILMLRSKQYTQNTDIPIRAGFSEEDLENALDHIVMLIQQLKEITDYCVQFDLTSETTGVTLPTPEAGKPIVGNSTGTGFENSTFDLTSLEDDVAAVAASVAAAAASASAASSSASAASASAAAAAASAASINLPAIAGNALKLVRAKSDETGLEYISPAAFDSVLAMNGKIFKFAKGADVASAAGTITLGEDGNYFDITGTAAITGITAKTAGTVVMLQFDSTASLVDGGNLKLQGDFQGATETQILLVCDGTNWFELSRNNVSNQNFQVFTSSGTFVAPAGVTKVYITIAGGGGGSGGGGNFSAGGGGGGACAILVPYTVVPGNSYTVTVGAGGTPGTGGSPSGVSNGGTGGTSSFDSNISTAGGNGGALGTGAAGGAGGAALAEGSMNASGTTGGTSYRFKSGAGGTGASGAGGAGGASQLVNGVNASATGTVGNDGGGGASAASNSNSNGKTGGSGIVIVAY